MELLAYISIYFLTVLFAVFPRCIKESSFFIFWLAVAVSLSVVLRLSIGVGEAGDIEGYSILMSEVQWRAYYIREPIFWFSLSFLYSVFNNATTVFILLDFVLFLLLYKAFSLHKTTFFPINNDNNTKYILFGLFLFFPYVFGMHGIYRQLLATAFFLCAIGYTGNRKLFKGWMFFVISMLIHNAMAIFLPLLLYVCNKTKYKVLLIVVISTIPFFLNFALNSDNPYVIKSSFIAGGSIAYLYLLIFSFITIAVGISRSAKQYDLLFGYLLFIVIIYGFVSFIMSSGAAERVAMIVCSLLFPVLAYYAEVRFTHKIMVRLVYFHLSLLPLIFYYNNIIKI